MRPRRPLPPPSEQAGDWDGCRCAAGGLEPRNAPVLMKSGQLIVRSLETLVPMLQLTSLLAPPPTRSLQGG